MKLCSICDVVHGFSFTFSLCFGCMPILFGTGSIYMDNHDIQNIKLKSLRRHVGLVSQDIVSDT